MNITIIYDSPDFLALNKPSGLLTHPRNENDQRESVEGWLKENYPGAKYAHRLDKDTSGVLLVAKNQTALEYFKKLFHDRKIQKTYIALVHGYPKQDNGIIDAPLFKFGTRQSMRPPKKGQTLERAAVTEYKVLEKFDNFSLLEVTPRTGRTHQIRIHLRSIGHPVVCDLMYAEKSRLCPPELGRLFLHAKSLSFTSPTGQALTIEAGLPETLLNFLGNLRKK